MSQSLRDACAAKLSNLRKDDVITVGKTRWRVWRNQGTLNYVIKDGSKGTKLYDLHVTEIEPRCCIEVREISGGSGNWLGKPSVAKGCAMNGGGTWAGAGLGCSTRRRRRRRR